MASAGLLHPQVDENLLAIDAALQAGQRQLNFNGQPLRNAQTISNVWPQPPRKDHVHVHVKVDPTSEYFIHLLAPPGYI